MESMPEDRQLFVDKWLRVCGVADGSIIGLGDCARIQGEEQLPETAQVAAQQGAFVARLLNKESLVEMFEAVFKDHFSWSILKYLYEALKLNTALNVQSIYCTSSSRKRCVPRDAKNCEVQDVFLCCMHNGLHDKHASP